MNIREYLMTGPKVGTEFEAKTLSGLQKFIVIDKHSDKFCESFSVNGLCAYGVFYRMAINGWLDDSVVVVPPTNKTLLLRMWMPQSPDVWLVRRILEHSKIEENLRVATNNIVVKTNGTAMSFNEHLFELPGNDEATHISSFKPSDPSYKSNLLSAITAFFEKTQCQTKKIEDLKVGDPVMARDNESDPWCPSWAYLATVTQAAMPYIVTDEFDKIKAGETADLVNYHFILPLPSATVEMTQEGDVYTWWKVEK